MPVRPLVTLPAGEIVLRRPNLRVRVIDRGVQRLVDDMIETMYSANGVGLAAPQIGVNLRVAVIGLPGDPNVITLINPEIVRRSGSRVLEEGCLSIPGYWGEVTRSETVIARARNRHGKEIRVRASNDLLAQALEHEIDHLNGRLYIDRLIRPDAIRRVEAVPDGSDR